MFIKSGDHFVSLSCQGGSILQWQWKQHIILGPTRMERIGEMLKLRGESHWCYPNHGNGPGYPPFEPWPQHGFLRNSVITLRKLSENCADFKEKFYGDYPFSWDNQIEILTSIYRGCSEPDSLFADLEITNTTDPLHDNGGMPILPALHPYFNSEGGALVEIGKKLIPAYDGVLGPIVVKREDPIVIKLFFGLITMKVSDNCEWLVLWSDKPASYVCVEPVFCGKPGTFCGQDHKTYLPASKTEKCIVQFFFEPA